MINFFRRIRKKMADDNKPIKYMRYAIGEIILVVIGILIALQINNWNEDRKELNEEQKIVFSLNEKFKKNLIQLDSSIISIDKTLRGIDSILKVMNKTITLDSNPETLDKLLLRAINMPRFFPSSMVLKELEGSGKLTKLKNSKLKSLLYLWNSNIDKMEVALTLSTNSFEDALDYIKKNGSLRRIDYAMTSSSDLPLSQTIISQSNEHLLTDLQFENVVDDQYVLLGYRKEAYLEAKKVIEDIIKQTEPNSPD